MQSLLISAFQLGGNWKAHTTFKVIILLITFCSVAPTSLVLGEGKPPTWVPTPEERADHPWMPTKHDEVIIGGGRVAMPLGRILLARKGLEVCAIKFTDTWLGETQYDHYTSYQFHYQGDGSGDFSKGNVNSGSAELFFPRVRGFLGLPYQKGAKDTIRCGGMKFEWIYIATITFDDAELAPTPWISITDVKVDDPRIRWYRKGEISKTLKVDIDRLWGNSPQPKAGNGGRPSGTE